MDISLLFVHRLFYFLMNNKNLKGSFIQTMNSLALVSYSCSIFKFSTRVQGLKRIYSGNRFFNSAVEFNYATLL